MTFYNSAQALLTRAVPKHLDVTTPNIVEIVEKEIRRLSNLG